MSDEDKAGFQKLLPIWKTYKDRVSNSPLSKEDWSFRAIRPANYPYRRIAGLAHLIVRHEKEGMFVDFMGSFQKILASSGNEPPDKKTLNTFNDFFCLSVDDYWANHYTPDGKTLTQPQQLVGSAQSREIIINIGLPIGLIFAASGKVYGVGNRTQRAMSIRKESQRPQTATFHETLYFW